MWSVRLGLFQEIVVMLSLREIGKVLHICSSVVRSTWVCQDAMKITSSMEYKG